jgi:hypothetical protein
MAGFSGRVLLEGDRGGAEQLLPKALDIANQLNAWKTAQNIPAVSKAFDLGDGSYCVVADLQNIRSLLVVCPPTFSSEVTLPEFDTEEPPTTGVIDVVSGIVYSPTLVEEEISASAITPGKKGTVKKLLLNGFVPCEYTEERYTDVQRRYRLGVKEDAAFSAIDANPELIYSEHAHVKPSQYSGAMRRVVQLVLGIGQLVRPTWEETQIKNKTLESFLTDIPTGEDEPDPAMTSAFGLYGSKTDGVVTLKWDYRFARTHGISFDGDGKPWVIEISTRGVHAMRLHLDPVSTTKDGQERYKAASPELADFIDEFKGIPIGTGFPTTVEFEDYKKAGEIVELLSAGQMSDFYSKGMFSSDIGWSFNNRGSEAHNCAVGTEDFKSTGNHYRVRIKLGKEAPLKTSGPGASLISALSLTKTWQINKAKRMAEAVATSILKLITSAGVEAGMTEFKAVSVTPSMTGIASLQLVRSGFLYHPARPKGQPQIKFPEPLMGGLVSFDFGPYETGVGIDRCDAPMFVCHIDDDLEVINYFYDARPRTTPPPENDRVECQFTGGWTSTTYGGEPFIAGNFYSARWDWREEIVPEVRTTAFSGVKLGVQGVAAAQDFFSQCITVGSETSFNVSSRSSGYSGRSTGIAAAIPFHARDCYYMVRHDSKFNTPETAGSGIQSATGPHSQLWRLYNFVFHWVGRCGGEANIDAGTIGPIAKKFGEYLSESCVADQIPAFYYAVTPMYPSHTEPTVVMAPWGNGILGSAKWPNIKMPSTYLEVLGSPSITHASEIWMVTGNSGPIRTKKDSVTAPNAEIYDLDLSIWWFKFSPDPDSGAMPWMGVTESCLGNTIVNYHTDMDGYVVEYYGGPSSMHAGVMTCYTGVIE